MKPRHYNSWIWGLALAVLPLPALTTGCSNNIEQGLYPDSGDHISLTLLPAIPNNTLTIGSSQAATVLTVETTTRWTVEVTDCEGAWCQIVYGESPADQAGHIGSGSFSIEAAANRSDKERECTVTVYAIESDGTHIPGKSVRIQVEQDRQSIDVTYDGDVISAYGTAQGQQPTVTVSANQPWTVGASHDWVTIIPGEGMDGDTFTPPSGSSAAQTASFRFSVAPNPGTSTRMAEITISSPTSSFTPQRLNVTQEGSTETFFITPSNVSDIPYTGSVIELQVYSPREAWTAHVVPESAWVALDRTSGDASEQPLTVRVTVAPNADPMSRQAGIEFRREGDKGSTVVTLAQGGNMDTPNPNSRPVVSTPWIVDGWTASRAQLRAYYRASDIPVTGCGAYLTPTGDETARRTYTGTFGENFLISVDLTDLEPDTEYTVQAFVEYTLNGTATVALGGTATFTTPDRSGQPGTDTDIPNPDDNNPPSAN